MPDMTMMELAVLAGAALLVSLALIWVVGLLPERRTGSPAAQRPPDCHFLFRGGKLVDHDAGDVFPACADDPAHARGGGDWARFQGWLGFRFPDLPASPDAIPPGETCCFESHLPRDTAHLELQAAHGSHGSQGTVRLRLCEDRLPSVAWLNEMRRGHHAADAALQALGAAPYPVWISDDEGAAIWENSAAATLPDAHKAGMTAGLPPPAAPGETLTRRVSLSAGDPKLPDKWFDVTVEHRPDAGGTVFFANDISRLVAAETAQRGFVQTLGKTFADLPTGLAVFDRAKTLALFNPALTDLTGLQVEFLSARPEIVTFFDMLRDRQVMPEPKNYASWRSQINDMVNAAHGGHYREMWSLATGQSYRVTGRPHPDGAVAFLFEDITLEMSETRHQRGEMALRDALLDHLDEAIAVLSQDRGVIFCNRAFGDLLGDAADRPLTGMRLSDVMQVCQSRFGDTALWSEIAERIAANALQGPILETIAPNGPSSRIDLRLAPLGQGRAMLSLYPAVAEIAPRMAQHTG